MQEAVQEIHKRKRVETDDARASSRVKRAKRATDNADDGGKKPTMATTLTADEDNGALLESMQQEMQAKLRSITDEWQNGAVESNEEETKLLDMLLNVDSPLPAQGTRQYATTL